MNFKEEISLENLIKGYKFLNISFPDTHKTAILLPFLKAFTKQTILVEEQSEYNFRDIMAIFFILSKSSEKEKANGVFRVYDQGNDGCMNQKEIVYLLKKLMKSVFEYSNELAKRGEELRNQIKEMEKQIKFERKVKKMKKNKGKFFNEN